MSNYLKLYFTRILRTDINVPKRCNAHNYQIKNKTICDCKIWCKFPPPGTGKLAYISIPAYKRYDLEYGNAKM